MHAIRQNALSMTDSHIQWSHRDIPLSHGAHLCGRVAWTPSPQSVAVESQLEAQAVDFLTSHPHLIAVHSQPFSLRYWDGKRLLRYTPDFLVVYKRLSRSLLKLGFERWTVIEVKPSSHWASHRIEVARRLQAVHDLMGLATVCLTELELLPGRVQS
jgi:hypothetical protein